MFLSRLILNSISRQVCMELREPYQMHRTIMSAFPTEMDNRNERVLFRLDFDRAGNALILLVQSFTRPSWPETLIEKGYLSTFPGVKEFSPGFQAGSGFFFRLRANPTIKRDGKREALVRETEQRSWLKRKAEASGFRLDGFTVISEGKKDCRKHDHSAIHDMTLNSVRYEGLLEVTDARRFGNALKNGIGSAKAFGFGLLSLARVGD